MSDEIKQNITEQSTWIRALYMLIFFIIYGVAKVVIAAVVVFQFINRLLTASLNPKLLKFGADLSVFVYDILMFLTYNSESKPFPFSEWPSNSSAASETNKKAASKKRTSKKSKVTEIKKDKSDDDDDGQNSGV